MFATDLSQLPVPAFNDRFVAGGRMAEPRKKILCIEDDRETAALIVEELADRGFEPIVAYSGAEAGPRAV
jgi:hypothetical protein